MDSAEAKARYAAKVQMFFGIDPGKVTTREEEIPLSVTYDRIYQFLVRDEDPFSGNPKECTKGLDAFLYVENGWVKKVSGKKVNDTYVVQGSVLHSFSLNETPLRPWVLVKFDGRILAAHCNCAIGLLEACSHIGATLFTLDILRKDILDDKKLSVTDLPAYWKNPPKKINCELYKKVKDINFGKKIMKEYQLMLPREPNDSEIGDLLTSIQTDGVCVAAMSTFCGDEKFKFSCDSCTEEHELLERTESFNLTRLYRPVLEGASLEELQREAPDIYANLNNDPQIIHDIELLTAAQSDCKLWSVLRTGRITASLLKDVLRTSFENPSISLVKKICYPETCTFTTPAVKYGKQNEQKAIDSLYQLVCNNHVNLRSIKSGLHIDRIDPCLGASPDAIFLCDCHGTITVEVKCPFSAKNCESITQAVLNLSDPFILIDDEGSVFFSTTHKYFWQVLMQIHVCEASFGYFYVWSENEQIVFAVSRENDVWNECKLVAVDFFKRVIIPELLSKYFTKSA